MKKVAVNYRNYMLEHSSREKENIEWSVSYSYNARDNQSMRVLLIGDSICNGYQPYVRENLGNCVNVTYWASSKCVTDMLFLREVDFYLDLYDYDLILFNNGCHSTDEFPSERELAYKKVVEFILEKCKKASVALVLCTPVRTTEGTEKLRKFNQFTIKTAKEYNLEIVDLFYPMENENKEKAMCDAYHWNEDAQKAQAKIISDFIIKTLKPSDSAITQLSTDTGPSGTIN